MGLQCVYWQFESYFLHRWFPLKPTAFALFLFNSNISLIRRLGTSQIVVEKRTAENHGEFRDKIHITNTTVRYKRWYFFVNQHFEFKILRLQAEFLEMSKLFIWSLNCHFWGKIADPRFWRIQPIYDLRDFSGYSHSDSG